MSASGVRVLSGCARTSARAHAHRHGRNALRADEQVGDDEEARHLDRHPAGELPLRQDRVHDAAGTLARRHEHMLQAREACGRQTPTGCFLHTPRMCSRCHGGRPTRRPGRRPPAASAGDRARRTRGRAGSALRADAPRSRAPGRPQRPRRGPAPKDDLRVVDGGDPKAAARMAHRRRPAWEADRRGQEDHDPWA